jgi:hypothetical protein
MQEAIMDNYGERIDTTIGDLVSAVSETAIELCQDKRVAYLLASIVLEDILQSAAWEADDAPQISGARHRKTVSFH